MKRFLQVTKIASQNSSERFFKKCVDIVFTQMNAKKGFRKYGKVAVSAVIKEFWQLVHGAFPGKKVVKGVDPKTLTEEEKQQALDAVNLIKEKRTGEIKGRTCANGSKQCLYLKENKSVASPTVSLEGLITLLIIDAYEGREVSSFDVSRSVPTCNNAQWRW